MSNRINANKHRLATIALHGGQIPDRLLVQGSPHIPDHVICFKILTMLQFIRTETTRQYLHQDDEPDNRCFREEGSAN